MSRRFQLAWLVSVVVTVAIATVVALSQVETPTQSLLLQADNLAARTAVAGDQASRAELEECEALYREVLARDDLDKEERARVERTLPSVIARQDPARIDAQLDVIVLPLIQQHGLQKGLQYLLGALRDREAFDVMDRVFALCEREFGKAKQADISYLRERYGRPKQNTEK